MPDSERLRDGATTVASDSRRTAATSPSDRVRARIGLALRFFLSVGLLSWLVLEIDSARVGDILEKMDWRWLGLAVVMLMAGRALVAYRWYLLVREVASHVSFVHLLRIVLISGFVGAAVPGGVGIELYRMYALGRGTSLALGVSSVVVERLTALVGLVLLVALGVLWAMLEGALGLPQPILLATGLSILCVAAVNLVVVNRRLRAVAMRVVQAMLGPAIGDRIDRVFSHIDAFHGNRRLLFSLVGLSLALQVLRVLEIKAMALALGIQAAMAAFVVIVPIGILASLLPISILGLGVKEALYVGLFQPFGVGAAAAFTLSLFSFVVIFAVLTLPGAWLFAWYGGKMPAAGAAAATSADGALRPRGRFSFLRR
jgi:uncharacterized protein (TIRG00374 family)